MKKVFIGLLCLYALSNIAFAAEAQQVANDNKALVLIQKQPSNKEQKQKITRNIACIIIQINGKSETKTNNKSTK